MEWRDQLTDGQSGELDLRCHQSSRRQPERDTERLRAGLHPGPDPRRLRHQRAGRGLTTPALDGTGQTIAIVEAYDDPDIFQAVDDYDTQFSLTDSGPSLYDQYGPASSFLTVVNQNGQSAPLPETDPSGAGTENWELEESLDVEWAHAIAPGAQIVVVEANSQSLSDLMASCGHGRQPAWRVGGIDELGLAGRTGCFRQR